MSGRVKDGIGDSRCYTDNAGLSQASRADWIDNRIAFFDEDHVDVVDGRISRHVIIRETDKKPMRRIVLEEVESHESGHCSWRNIPRL